MQVDFDPNSRQLTFSRSQGGSSNSKAENWRKRLYKQARPAQIQLLKEFGQRTAGGQGSNAEQEHLLCVCGSRLNCTPVRQRVENFVQEETPMAVSEFEMNQFYERPPIMCDICNKQVSPNSEVWTCENGRRTVLHSVAYDVCQFCFERYARGKLPHPGQPGHLSADEEEEDEEEDDDEDFSDEDFNSDVDSSIGSDTGISEEAMTPVTRTLGGLGYYCP